MFQKLGSKYRYFLIFGVNHHTMPNYNWKETELFKILLAKKAEKDFYADNMVALLENPDAMKKIEDILNKGGTMPKDFTLHDADHSYRVAVRMSELMPQESKNALTSYELGFLLLSAYLHDIGMSPEFDKVESHRLYLTTDDKIGLTEDEVKEFQKWIDNDNFIDSIDITKEKVDNIHKSNYILSYYIRYRHNDWSGEWIQNNLKDILLDRYPNWQSDLIRLCKSHHYGIEKLLKDEFNPNAIGSDSHIHLRYLAMCLRVADVMENDPERTPEVVLNHRAINKSSIKYWEKDKYFNLQRIGNKYTVHSSPEKAYIHKAVEETSQWIEDELRLCDELQDLKPLNISATCFLNDNYFWNIEPTIYTEIKPKDNAYEYIPGAFRPNTAKILEILGGNQLYGDSIWAFRELIQNSFDAVKERIAYEILSKDKDPNELLDTFSELYTISISLEKRAEEYWLICKDEGVGMTKSIIQNFFLVSGSSKRHEIKDLERRCLDKGFVFTRTGQFGIGVLSYFMIADTIIVKTKREQDTGYQDEESLGWYFEINGTHDFGELKKIKHNYSGTTIEFKLKKEIENDIDVWGDRFAKFFTEKILYAPCNIEFFNTINNNQLKFLPKWTNNKNDIKDIVKTKFKHEIIENIELSLLSQKEKERLTIKNKFSQKILNEIDIKFLVEEGIIQGVGKYRIHIPYFKLEKGNSLVYFKEEIEEGEHRIIEIGNTFSFQPKFDDINTSIKGVAVSINNNNMSTDAWIEFDIETLKEKSLSVSRHSLKVNRNDFNTYQMIFSGKIKNLLEKNKLLFENQYILFSGNFLPINDKHYWLFPKNNHINDNEIIFLKEIIFPVSFDYSCSGNNYVFRNNKICFIGDVTQISLNYLVSNNYILGFLEITNGFESIPILLNLFDVKLESNSVFNSIELPSQWNSNIIFYNSTIADEDYYDDKFYLSKNSNFFKLYDSQIYDLMHINIEEKDLINEKFYFNFLLFLIYTYSRPSWIAICEQKEKIIKNIFDILKSDEFYIVNKDLEITKISVGIWDIETDEIKIQEVIPEIPADCIIRTE